MAAELLLNTELSSNLYQAVSNKDYKRIVLLYADIARKAILCNSRWGGGGSTGVSASSAVGNSLRNSANGKSLLNLGSNVTSNACLIQDEKVDEYFQNPTSANTPGIPSRMQAASSRQPPAPYNLMVMEELDSIMEMALASLDFDAKESDAAVAAEGSAKMEHDELPTELNLDINDDKDSDYIMQQSENLFQDEKKYKNDLDESSSVDAGIWQQARRSRKTNNYYSYASYSQNISFFQEEEESMRIAAKVLSNARAPPTFVLYGDEQEQGAMDNEEGRTPLFDGSAAGSGGTLLHLACIVDAPLALALLLAFGGDPSGRHSAFRRLPVHEASCSDSLNCLSLLLFLANTDYDSPKFQDAAAASPVTSFPTHPSTSSRPYFSFTQTLRLILSLLGSNPTDELAAAKVILSHVTLPHSTRSALLTFSPTSLTADGHGNTPLHWAAFKNSTACVSLLLSAGADPNAKAHPSGWTPLHDAAYSNASSSLSYLLQAGAYVDARASSGATPLCFAAQEDAPDSAHLLLAAGASTVIRCCGNPIQQGVPAPPPSSRFSGYTPLHYCAHYNASKAAKLLLQHNADKIIEITDLSNKLPIHVAVLRGSDEVLKLLLAFGATPPSPNQVPKKPVQSTKPWNCLTKERISKCLFFLEAAAQHWNFDRHVLFPPCDRDCIMTILCIAKRSEQRHAGIYLKEVWLEVLTFIPRGWFYIPQKNDAKKNFVFSYIPSPRPLIDEQHFTTASIATAQMEDQDEEHVNEEDFEEDIALNQDNLVLDFDSEDFNPF